MKHIRFSTATSKQANNVEQNRTFSATRTYKRRVRQQAQALERRQLDGPVGDEQHDERLGVVPVQPLLVPVLGEVRRQREDAAGQLLGQDGVVAQVLALEAPDGLPVAVLEVEPDAERDVREAGPQVGDAGRAELGGCCGGRRVMLLSLLLLLLLLLVMLMMLMVGGRRRRWRDREGSLRRRGRFSGCRISTGSTTRPESLWSEAVPKQHARSESRYLQAATQKEIQFLFQVCEPLLLGWLVSAQPGR